MRSARASPVTRRGDTKLDDHGLSGEARRRRPPKGASRRDCRSAMRFEEEAMRSAADVVAMFEVTWRQRRALGLILTNETLACARERAEPRRAHRSQVLEARSRAPCARAARMDFVLAHPAHRELVVPEAGNEGLMYSPERRPRFLKDVSPGPDEAVGAPKVVGRRSPGNPARPAALAAQSASTSIRKPARYLSP